MKKRDVCYLLFFTLHIPIMLVVDFVPLYPSSVHSYFPFLLQIRNWYIKTYKDRFFTHPPAWFTLYAWLEVLYHLPVSTWAIGALIRDDPKLPLVLLLFAAETAITTATCVVEFLSWKGYSSQEKLALGGLYGPYMILGAFWLNLTLLVLWQTEAYAKDGDVALFMCTDMYMRLDAKLAKIPTGAKSKSS